MKTLLQLIEELAGHNLPGTVKGDIFYPSRSLNIERAGMPQISTENVPAFLSFLGVKHLRKNVKVDTLKATQSELRVSQAQGILNAKGIEFLKTKVMLVSKDNYIMDGHHRWLSVLLDNPKTMIPIIQVDMGIHDLLKATESFSKTERRDISHFKMYAK